MIFFEFSNVHQQGIMLSPLLVAEVFRILNIEVIAKLGVDHFDRIALDTPGFV